jgi:tRNA(fMet)-specific endonuclease VapC
MTLDTNILIAYLEGDRSVVEFVLTQKEIGKPLFVSSVSVAELLSGKMLTQEDIVHIRSLVNSLISIPFDNALAESVGALRRQYKLSVPDAAVAATALAHHSPLVTRDKGFWKVKELTCVEI